MNRPEAAAVVTRLIALFPNYRPADETMAAEMWQEILADMDYPLVRAALMQYASESHDFAPAPGTIRQYAIHLQAKSAGVPSAAAAMQEVMDMPPSMKRRRDTNGARNAENVEIVEYEMLRFSHPFVEKIARMIGWPKTWPSDNAAADRAQFLKIYDSELKNALDRDFAPPAVKAYLSGPQSINKLLKG